MNIPTLPNGDVILRTVEDCRALCDQAIEYIRYASENLGPDECQFDKAAKHLKDAVFWEYWIVGSELNPGSVEWHPFHDRATHEATVARMGVTQ